MDLKLIYLDLYHILEPFWHGKMHGQYVFMALIIAGANLILKILWNLIVDKKKEHLSAQYNALRQNTELKEKQLKSFSCQHAIK